MMFRNNSEPLSGRMHERTHTLMKGDSVKEKRSRSFIQAACFSLIITVVCTLSDYAALLPMLDDLINMGDAVGKIVTLAISTTENTLPLVAVYFLIRHKYQPNRYSIIPFWLILISLAAFLGCLFYARWEYIPFSADHTDIEEELIAARENADQAAALLLGILPVITSIANGLLYYITSNVYDKRRQALRMRIFELTQQLAEVQATIDLLSDQKGLETYLEEQRNQAYKAAVADADAIVRSFEDYSVLKLASVLHNPDVITRYRVKNHHKK